MSRDAIDQAIFFWLLILFQFALFGWIEKRWGARRIEWRKIWLADVVALLFCTLIVFRLANYINVRTPVYGPWPDAIKAWPFPVRLLLYIVVADFGAYWMHRLVHIGLLWRVHRWHHSPPQMYWLAGIRGSVFQTALFNLPYIFASPILGVSTFWLANGLLFLSLTTNGWMHMNVGWRLRGLDWLLVTPQSHHIHHSQDPAHYNSNFGVIFSVWDRLFGTFTSPHETDPKALRFGIAEKVPLARLTIGL